MRRSLKALCFTVVALCVAVGAGYASDAKDAKIKVFIRADSTVVNGQKFVDKDLEDSAQDLRRSPRGFVLAPNEADADLLFVVIKRELQTAQNSTDRRILTVAISTRDSADWKPATVITKNEQVHWSTLAHEWMGEAGKWAKANFKK